jgi:hypothetical protein
MLNYTQGGYMNAEKETAVRITLDKNKQITVQAERCILPEAISLCLCAIEAMCKQTLSRTDDPELLKSLEEDMYEMINVGASSLLDKLFPHISARPDITVDAIMKAEDELLKEKGDDYMEAYADTAQAQKDVYEHAMAKAELAAQEMNRQQRRAHGVKNKK